MRKRTKARLLHRLGAWALALCLVAGLLPGTAFAAETDTGKAIQLGSSAITTRDMVYYGNNLRWKVLSTNGNGGIDYVYGKNQVDSSDVLFLFSEIELFKTRFCSYDNYTNVYTGSTLRSDLSSKISEYFSAAEQSAILKTKKEAASTVVWYGYNATNPIINYDQLFALSAEEMQTYLGYDKDNPSTWTAGLGGDMRWWLRSAIGSSFVGTVAADGQPSQNSLSSVALWVRPAFNLNLNAVLFISAPAAKVDIGMDSGLAAVNDYTGNEWKLTLLDSTRSFSVTENSLSAAAGGTVTVNYSGAQTGSNEYVSAMLVDGSGSVLCYGRVAPGSASGTASITIPDGLAPGSYTLKVFSEQYNGDKMTDYASAFQDIALTVTEAGPDTPETPTNPFTVTTSGGGDAAEGTDYTWDGTVLTLLTDGLTLATPGYTAETPAAARIVLQSGTHQVTLNGVHLSSDAQQQNTITFNSGGTSQNALILQGQNSIASTAAETKGVLAFGSLTIKSQSGQSGSLDLSGNSGVWSDDTLTVENAEVTADTTRNCLESSNNQLIIKNATVKAETQTSAALFGYQGVTIENSVVAADAPEAHGYGIGSRSDNVSITSNSFVCTGGIYGGAIDKNMPSVSSSIWLRKYNQDMGGIFDASGDRTASGASFTLTQDAEIPAGYTLPVRAGQTLTIASGVTLSGAGTVDYSAEGAVFNRDNEYGSCTVANQIGPGGTGTGHTHSWSDTWSSDAAHHWHECTAEGCPETDNSQKDGYGAHVYTDETDTICNDCGYERTIGGDDPEPGHTHSWSDTWSSDAAHHWHECTAEGCPVTGNSQKDDYGAHVYTDDADTTCDTCGYVRQVASTEFTITFDGNGGSSPASQTTVDGKLTSLPTSTRSGYNFLGWYTAASGGTAVTTSTVFTADDTLYAHWSRRSSGGGSSGGGSGSSGSTTYVPSVDAGRNGDVTVSPSRPSSGQTVTITVDPDAGYALDDLTVTDARGNVVKVTDNGDGTYSFTQPSSKVTIEATFAEIQDEPTLAFVDVPESAYYYDAVLWAVENGVTNGTSSVTFSPDANVSRAQMVTFLWRAAGSPEPQSSVNPFTDVSSSAYYYDAVLWAVENGITNGTSATTFVPESAVSRAQAVTFLWRSASSPVVSGGSFADVADDAYYAQAVAWAAQEGITSGTGGNSFSPDLIVSRAQAVTFLHRQLG